MVRAVAAGACLLALTGSTAAGRPNLVEGSFSVSQHAASLRITDVARNIGAGVAGTSTTAYYLGRVRIGGRAVPVLPPRGRSRGSVALSIPATVRPGSYRLRACADARRRVRESAERDNCRTAAQTVRVTDRTPPVFAGLDKATTCIPGPVGDGGRSSPYFLRWAAATDDVTLSSAIVYDVYEASVAGGEDFAAPTYTTAPGATTFSTPPLPDNKSHHFVVRARDQAGNADTNEVERLGVNLCL